MRTNKLLTISAGLLILVFAEVVSSQAQTDLSTRKAVYFTGAKTGSIDLKNDKYVAGSAVLSLSPALGTSCDNNVCEFNVGIIAFRTGTGALSTDIVIKTDKGGSFTKVIQFAANEKTKQVIFPIKLAGGKNQLTLVIDPNRKTAETDESNNRFAGTVTVEPLIGGTIISLPRPQEKK